MIQIDLDLETEFHASLKELLEREISNEYEQKIVTKGRRLAQGAKLILRIQGEEILGQCDDGRGQYGFSFSLPLFDLDEGYSSARCDCQNRYTGIDDRRCHHLYFAQSSLLTHLESLLEDNSQNWRQSFQDMEPGDPITTPQVQTKTVWMIHEPYLARPHAQKSTNAVRHPKITWTDFLKGEHWTNPIDQLCAARVSGISLGGATPDYQVDEFGLLKDLRGESVAWAKTGAPLKIRSGSFGLSFQKAEEGYIPKMTIEGQDGNPSYIKDKGMILVTDDLSTIYIAETPPHLDHLVKSFCENPPIIPAADRSELLHMLEKWQISFPIDFSNIVEHTIYAEQVNIVFRLTPGSELQLVIEGLVRPVDGGRTHYAGLGPDWVLDLTDPETPQKIKRDFDLERQTLRTFERQFDLDRYPKDPDYPKWLLKGEEVLDLIRVADELPQTDHFTIEWPKNSSKKSVKASTTEDEKLTISSTKGHDWFGLQIKVPDLDDEIDFQELVEALKNKRRYIKLKSGSYSLISQHFRQQLERIHETLPTVSMGGDGTSCLPVLKELSEESSGGIVLDQQLKDRLDHYQDALAYEPPIPEGMNATLRPYQEEGFRFLMKSSRWLSGVCLADDMGLGKTLQTLTFLVARQNKGPALVICPASLVSNWKDEIQKFCPSLSAISYVEFRDRSKKELNDGDVLLLTYGLALADIENLKKLTISTLVLDEAQTVKNSDSKTWRALHQLSFDFGVALSGTPVENNLGDLYGIMSLIAPGFLGTKTWFKETFLDPITKAGDQRALRQLHKLTGQAILRRIKTDCLKELPEKHEITIKVSHSDEEKRFYEALRIGILQDLEKNNEEDEQDQEKGQFAVLAGLLKLRLSACHPILVDSDWEGQASKLLVLLRLLENLRANGQKALVFSQFVSHLKLIQQACFAREFRVAYLDGSTKLKERKQLVDEFQGDQYDIFLISLKAGGTGLNLTAAGAVIHVDPWWNPAVEDQASDRAYRMGQKNEVTVYRLVTEETVEEKIMNLHKDKRALASQVLAGTKSAKKFDPEFLRNLLS